MAAPRPSWVYSHETIGHGVMVSISCITSALNNYSTLPTPSLTAIVLTHVPQLLTHHAAAPSCHKDLPLDISQPSAVKSYPSILPSTHLYFKYKFCKKCRKSTRQGRRGRSPNGHLLYLLIIHLNSKPHSGNVSCVWRAETADMRAAYTLLVHGTFTHVLALSTSD